LLQLKFDLARSQHPAVLLAADEEEVSNPVTRWGVWGAALGFFINPRLAGLPPCTLL